MSEKVKVGIWGLGRAGGGMHMREIEANKDILEIVAVCDIDDARAEEFGKKLNVPFYTDPANRAEAHCALAFALHHSTRYAVTLQSSTAL